MLASVALTAFALALGVNAQKTNIYGTWSSGSGAVLTGGEFCSPADMTFTYPNNTGISYSFTSDGFYEEAQYRYDSNATNPRCIRGKIIWQHGRYSENSDGSITMTPFGNDGRIQVQDPCAAETNVVTYYNEPGTFKNYALFVDSLSRRDTLQLYAFDGAKLAPMYLAFDPAQMLPTKTLTGMNETGQTITKRGLKEKRSSAQSVNVGRIGVAGVVLAATALSVIF